MVYPAPFLRLVLGGTLFNRETFTMSLSLYGGPQAPDEVPQAIVDAATDFWTSAGIQTAARLTYLKLNEIGTNGRYTQPNTVRLDLPAPVEGTSAGNARPAQVAMAVTFTTSVARGRASRGRFYVPLPGGALELNGAMQVSSVQQLYTAARVFLEDLGGVAGGYYPVVVSDIGTGTMRYITGLSVGRIPDTIRSRRSSLPEEPLTGDLNYATPPVPLP